MTTPRPQPLKNDLTSILETLISSVLDKQPALEDEKFVNELVKTAKNHLKNEAESEGRNDISLEQVFNPEFIKEFSLCAMIGATLKDNKELGKSLDNALDTLLNNKEFMKEFKELCNKPDQPELKKGLELEKLLKKHFKPEQIADLKKGLDQFSEKMHSDMKNTFNKDKEPDKQIKPTKEMEKAASNDMYTNLFGLLNSAIAGAHPVPVSSFLGNGLGFNDWNPYNGNANIDAQNSINDYQFGDSQGLNASTVRNYSMIPDTMVDDFTALLDAAGISPPSTAPTPSPFKR